MREEQLLKDLVAARGVAGFEKEVRKLIEEQAAPYADEIPGFWLGLMLMLLFSLKLKWLPAYGAGSLKHFILS